MKFCGRATPKMDFWSTKTDLTAMQDQVDPKGHRPLILFDILLHVAETK